MTVSSGTALHYGSSENDYVLSGVYEKRLTFLSVSVAPAGIELLNLWNDFRKVVKFIDENPWVKPMLARIQSDKNRGGK